MKVPKLDALHVLGLAGIHRGTLPKSEYGGGSLHRWSKGAHGSMQAQMSWWEQVACCAA